MLTRALSAFLSMFALDLVFALYVAAVGQHDALMASLYAAAIVACNAVLVLVVVKDWRMAAPAAAGAFAGTWLAVAAMVA